MGFTWDLLYDNTGYEELNECKEAVKNLLDDKDIFDIINKYLSVDDKISKLRQYDDEIPSHPLKKYKLNNINELDERLKCVERSRR